MTINVHNTVQYYAVPKGLRGNKKGNWFYSLSGYTWICLHTLYSSPDVHPHSTQTMTFLHFTCFIIDTTLCFLFVIMRSNYLKPVTYKLHYKTRCFISHTPYGRSFWLYSWLQVFFKIMFLMLKVPGMSHESAHRLAGQQDDSLIPPVTRNYHKIVGCSS